MKQEPIGFMGYCPFLNAKLYENIELALRIFIIIYMIVHVITVGYSLLVNFVIWLNSKPNLMISDNAVAVS